MERISERIMFLPPDEEHDRPLIGYVKGDSFSIAIDAGSSAMHAKLFHGALAEEQLPMPSLTILTHSHWDHSYGLSAATGLSIACTETCRHLQDDINAGNVMIYHSYISEDYSYLRREYSSPEMISIRLPDITFSGSMTIDLGGIHAVLKHIRSPHSDDSTVIFIPEEKTIFLGDASSGIISSDADLITGGIYREEDLSAYIREISSFGAEIAVNSHSGADSMESELEYLSGKLAEIRSAER